MAEGRQGGGIEYGQSRKRIHSPRWDQLASRQPAPFQTAAGASGVAERRESRPQPVSALFQRQFLSSDRLGARARSGLGVDTEAAPQLNHSHSSTPAPPPSPEGGSAAKQATCRLLASAASKISQEEAVTRSLELDLAAAVSDSAPHTPVAPPPTPTHSLQQPPVAAECIQEALSAVYRFPHNRLEPVPEADEPFPTDSEPPSTSSCSTAAASSNAGSQQASDNSGGQQEDSSTPQGQSVRRIGSIMSGVRLMKLLDAKAIAVEGSQTDDSHSNASDPSRQDVVGPGLGGSGSNPSIDSPAAWEVKGAAPSTGAAMSHCSSHRSPPPEFLQRDLEAAEYEHFTLPRISTAEVADTPRGTSTRVVMHPSLVASDSDSDLPVQNLETSLAKAESSPSHSESVGCVTDKQQQSSQAPTGALVRIPSADGSSAGEVAQREDASKSLAAPTAQVHQSLSLDLIR